MKSKNLSILIDKEDYEKLCEIAEEEMRNVSQLMRVIIKKYLEEKGDK